MKLNINLLHSCLMIIFVPLFFSNVKAQSASDKYQTESIYLKGSKYVKNGVEHTITSWNGDLKKEMEISPFAAVEYEKFQKTRKIGFILSTVGILALGSSLFVDNNDGAQNIMQLGGIGLILVSIPIKSKANKNLQKAVWLRNSAVLN
jgi:hypothetical protein